MTGWSLETYTTSDGVQLQYRRYPAVAPTRAHVVCLHGIQSHAGWYEASCRRLAAAGFTVSFLDRRGSGANPQLRGDAPTFRHLLDDVADFLRPLRSATPPLKIVLLAISWGGKPAVALQRRHPGLVDALALLCPGFSPRVAPSLRDRFAILAARLTAPARLFPIPLNEPELFTDDPGWRQFIRDDPFALRRATARLMTESVRLDFFLRWFPPRITIPVLLQLAGRDAVIDNERTRKLIARWVRADLKIIEYPAARHTLEFESGDEHVDDLLSWLAETVAEITPVPISPNLNP